MKKTKKGFTLVELVIVVAVMAVLVAVAIPTVSAVTNKAQTSVAKTNAKTIESMLKLYQAENTTTQTASGTTFDWTADKVELAIDNAKLGITDTATAFIFDPETGTVRTAAKSSVLTEKGEDEIAIAFSSTGDADAS